MKNSPLSIWFFVGILLTVYGALIFCYGISELVTGHLAPVVMANLHTPIWWGGAQLALGIFYLAKFRPAKAAK
jgi:hypothetical protein